MWIVEQNVSEEWAAGTKDNFVGFDLLVVNCCQSYIGKVLVNLQLFEGVLGNGLKVV